MVLFLCLRVDLFFILLVVGEPQKLILSKLPSAGLSTLQSWLYIYKSIKNNIVRQSKLATLWQFASL